MAKKSSIFAKIGKGNTGMGGVTNKKLTNNSTVIVIVYTYSALQWLNFILMSCGQ